jgi:hypothetical protein
MKISGSGFALLELDNGTATAKQVEDQHYYCDDDQQVNQVAADAADKSQQPQNEKNNEDCPKHGTPPKLFFALSDDARIDFRLH